MPKEKIYFLKNSREVSIKKRKGSRRMSIRIDPEGKVRMIIPYYGSYRDAIKFIEEKRDWIEKTCLKIQERKKEKPLYSEENLPRTRYHEFVLTPVAGEELSFRLSQGLCEIFVPSKAKISPGQLQQWIQYAYTETLRKEAKIVLVNRCYELAEKLGIKLNAVRVKNMKTRWGSCSTRGNINLNIHLMRLPGHLTDYVIYHELVHTIHHNHGPSFWKELDQYTGNAKKMAAELKNWGWVLAG